MTLVAKMPSPDRAIPLGRSLPPLPFAFIRDAEADDADLPAFLEPEAAMPDPFLANAPQLDLDRLAALGQMTTGIVHDFGNLMQVMTSAVEIIERNLGQPNLADMRTHTQAALDSIDRAAALTKQILGFSRTESAGEKIVDPALALAAIAKPIGWLAGSDVKVEMAIDGALPTIFCNGRELENAVFNLVVNAKDAMANRGRLWIAAFQEGGKDSPIFGLRVTDTGCGMSPEVAKRALQPRFTTKAGRGNGLGLAMVNDFVRRAGGSIQIDSAVNRGTAITLRLPACRG
ncbi:MAG: ATP-binding protein [Rhizomicrobium sp.]